MKVIKDVDFSWMNPETSVTTKSTRTHPRALILEPTRELAIQVKNHLMAAAKYSDLSVSERMITIEGGNDIFSILTKPYEL